MTYMNKFWRLEVDLRDFEEELAGWLLQWKAPEDEYYKNKNMAALKKSMKKSQSKNVISQPRGNM